jgi:N-acylglucosamine 2-epimerase
MLGSNYLCSLRDFYEGHLLDDIIPFWLKHGRDEECGGYVTCLNRDGSVYDYDKLCMWQAGRMVWTFSWLYNEFRQEPEWLDMANWGLGFIRKHGFAPNGTMYYALTRDGRPLSGAQDVYTELFSVLGFSEYARATGNEDLYDRAKRLFLDVWDRFRVPGRAFQPFDAASRPARLHGHSMITLNVLQTLRRCQAEPVYDDLIDECLDNIINLHLKRERKAVLELVGWDGEELPGSAGRWVNPGHMIEGGTFIIHEAQKRKDDALGNVGIDFIEWGFEWGWDKEFGGIYNDVDAEGLPIPTSLSLLAESKLWWQHTEALYGTLLAYCLTEDEKFLKAYRLTHDYCSERFADGEYGEWFATLDRRGNRVNDAKGTARKSPFHIARNFFLCYKLLGDLIPG